MRKLGEALAQSLLASLKAQGLTDTQSVVTAYASPRRLAAHVTAVAPKAADRAVRQKLMPVSVGLDAQGQPTTDPRAALAGGSLYPIGGAKGAMLSLVFEIQIFSILLIYC